MEVKLVYKGLDVESVVEYDLNYREYYLEELVVLSGTGEDITDLIRPDVMDHIGDLVLEFAS